jgi:hypothetical protein
MYRAPVLEADNSWEVEDVKLPVSKVMIDKVMIDDVCPMVL